MKTRAVKGRALVKTGEPKRRDWLGARSSSLLGHQPVPLTVTCQDVQNLQMILLRFIVGSIRTKMTNLLIRL